MTKFDAVVVGAGPNGLSAAIALAQAGRSVKVIEGAETIGGGARTMELTRPGFRHDVCSAVHPLGLGSPYFRQLPLEDFGLKWIQPKIPFAHPLSPKEAVFVERSVAATAAQLGTADGEEYSRRIEPLVEDWSKMEPSILGPILRVPKHPLTMAKFGWVGALPAASLVKAFSDEPAKAMISGAAAHAFKPLNRMLTASFGLLYPITAHRFGWPFAEGGSQSIIEALAGYLRSLGGEIEVGRWVKRMSDLPPARATLFDVTPEVLMGIAGDILPNFYRRQLGRFRRGPGTFKVDYALAGEVPWLNKRLGLAGTIHIGSSESIAAAEAAIWKGHRPARPFMMVAQQSMSDPTRAPAGQHTLWAYAHVPGGSTEDFSSGIEQEIENLAPGFKDLIIERCIASPTDLADYNPNYSGGDITGGAYTVMQTVFRPVPGRSPYATPAKGIYLCSSSTPPGAGVHGMCGYWAAQSALKRDLA